MDFFNELTEAWFYSIALFLCGLFYLVSHYKYKWHKEEPTSEGHYIMAPFMGVLGILASIYILLTDILEWIKW